MSKSILNEFNELYLTQFFNGTETCYQITTKKGEMITINKKEARALGLALLGVLIDLWIEDSK
jgi:hypothetical protein